MGGISEDFIEYWAAAKLNLAGANPYDSEQMLTLQQANGWTLPDPRMMWNPPHLLALVAPFSFLGYDLALQLWRILIVIGVLVCAALLWQFYGGPTKSRWVGIFLTVVFLPMLVSVAYGQLGLLILVGLTGFLFFQSRETRFCGGSISFARVGQAPVAAHLFPGATVLGYRSETLARSAWHHGGRSDIVVTCDYPEP